MSDTCPRCEYSGIMMALNDGSSTRFCECGFVFHTCSVHYSIVQGRGLGYPDNNACSCATSLLCPCSASVKVVQPGVLHCQSCGRHFVWEGMRQLYVATE